VRGIVRGEKISKLTSPSNIPSPTREQGRLLRRKCHRGAQVFQAVNRVTLDPTSAHLGEVSRSLVRLVFSGKRIGKRALPSSLSSCPLPPRWCTELAEQTAPGIACIASAAAPHPPWKDVTTEVGTVFIASAAAHPTPVEEGCIGQAGRTDRSSRHRVYRSVPSTGDEELPRTR
jgi:hypothetical protein